MFSITEQRSIPDHEIAELIRELRLALQLTQKQFAKELGMTFVSINRWENGHATPSPLALKQICLLLNQSCESLDPTLRNRSRAIRKQYFLQGCDEY